MFVGRFFVGGSRREKKVLVVSEAETQAAVRRKDKMLSRAAKVVLRDIAKVVWARLAENEKASDCTGDVIKTKEEICTTTDDRPE